MQEQQDRKRITWTVRVNVRPAARDQIKAIATDDRVSLATAIGYAIEDFVTARSTA